MHLAGVQSCFNREFSGLTEDFSIQRKCVLILWVV